MRGPVQPAPRPRAAFVVGCARSGTTLVQAHLAAHPQVVSFPEAHFFDRVAVRRRVPLLRGRAVSPRGRLAVQRTRERLDLPGAGRRIPRSLRLAVHVREFVAVMEEAALARGADVWLEKTPANVHALPLIEGLVPGATVVHVVRAGPPTVASLVDVTRRYPAWGGARSVEDCVAEWNAAVLASRRCLGRPGHVFVRYEDLVDEPRPVVEALLGALGLAPPDEAVVVDAAGLIAPEEVWKRSDYARVRRGEDKSRTVLTREERELAVRSLVSTDWLPARAGRPRTSPR